MIEYELHIQRTYVNRKGKQVTVYSRFETGLTKDRAFELAYELGVDRCRVYCGSDPVKIE